MEAKSRKIVGLAQQKRKRQVLSAFDKLEREEKRQKALKRADVERRARSAF